MKNRTLLFGEGLFETFRVYPGRKLAFVDDHLHRMEEGCHFFGLSFSRKDATEALRQALQDVPEDAQARLRLNLISYGNAAKENTTFETTWEPLQDTPKNEIEGVSLATAPFPRFSRSPLVRFKTTSYLENISVFTWARKEGFFDAIFTNERGDITEGSIANIFFVAKKHVMTPPLDAGLLPGVTRKQVFEIAHELGIPLKEETFTLEEIEGFQGVFITNSVIEILPVNRIGDTTFDKPDVITTFLEAYRKRLHSSFVTFPGKM